MENLPGKLVLIVGPSGSGKGSIIRELRKKHDDWVYPVSHTTRPIRPGEEDGLVYRFITKEDFESRIAEGGFLEYATVHGEHYYGTDKRRIMEGLEAGKVVVREVDIQGFNSILAAMPAENLVSVFVEVQDFDGLKERIRGRAEMSDDELDRRMESAKEEIAQADKCNYRIVNEQGRLEVSVDKVEEFILKNL